MAVLVLIVGAAGLYGITQIRNAQDEIATVNLPSIVALAVINEAQTDVRGRERGLLVKLDTNGSFPDRLEALLALGLVDWVALDIKAPLERYREVTRSTVDPEKIARAADLLRGSGVKHTFRTTVVPGLVGREDVVKIGEWLKGAERYLIQPFIPQTTIDPAYLQVRPFGRAELEGIAAAARPYFGEVVVEGPQ
jgi:pyruvate formate lyase activating enzyme